MVWNMDIRIGTADLGVKLLLSLNGSMLFLFTKQEDSSRGEVTSEKTFVRLAMEVIISPRNVLPGKEGLPIKKNEKITVISFASDWEICRTILSFLRSKHKKDTSLHIELLDDAWSIDENEYVNRALSEPMLNIGTHSKKGDDNQHCRTPSLDLEWENLPEMETSTYIASGEERETQMTTNSTCSHATSRDSLEWDPVISGMTDLIDAETEQLLQEIEMLNSKVLEETQTWSS